MLSIGNKIPLAASQGVKKPKTNSQNNQKSAPASLPQTSKAPSSPGSSGINTLEFIAMNNLLQNTNLSSKIKEPALNSINASLNNNINRQQSKVSSISSKLSESESKLGEINSILASSWNLSAQETEVYQLIASALQAELGAFQSLLDKTQNALSNLSYLAAFGVNQVIGESDQSPSLLDMLSRSNSEYSLDAGSKLLQMSSTSADATKKLGGLIQSGKASLKKIALKSKQEDPEKTAGGLDSLYRNINLSKEDKLTVTQVLSGIAIENPQNNAGKTSAEALENIFKKDSGAVAQNAAVGLRLAAIAGNEYATKGLINVANSPVAGKAKNQMAIIELTKVAKTGGNQSGVATDALTAMASGKGFSGKNKEELVNALGEIANTGGENGDKALNTLAQVASDDKSSAQKDAFNKILSLKTHKILGNSEVVKAFSSISESNKTDSKMQKQSTEKLGEAARFGTAATTQNAENSLTRIFTNPNSKSSGEAKKQLQIIGFQNISSFNQNSINKTFGNNKSESNTNANKAESNKSNNQNSITKIFGNNKSESNTNANKSESNKSNNQNSINKIFGNNKSESGINANQSRPNKSNNPFWDLDYSANSEFKMKVSFG